MKTIEEQIREVDKQIDYWTTMESATDYNYEKSKFTYRKEVYQSIKATLESVKGKK